MRPDDPNLPDLRRIAEALGELREQVTNRDFANVLPGLVAEPERAGLVMERLKALSDVHRSTKEPSP